MIYAPLQNLFVPLVPVARTMGVFSAVIAVVFLHSAVYVLNKPLHELRAAPVPAKDSLE